jgi:guanidinoacetate N-methyltransferase
MKDSSHEHFFDYWNGLEVTETPDGLSVGTYDIMFHWERPLMASFAAVLLDTPGDLLEIGFGAGIAATEFQLRSPTTHTIMEPHPKLYERAVAWKERYNTDIRLVADFWQNQANRLGRFHAIFYDSYSPAERIEDDSFAFFQLAAKQLLVPGGKLGFWHPGTALRDSFQRELLRFFRQVTIYPVHGLEPTPECLRRGFGSTMIAPVATL